MADEPMSIDELVAAHGAVMRVQPAGLQSTLDQYGAAVRQAAGLNGVDLSDPAQARAALFGSMTVLRLMLMEGVSPERADPTVAGFAGLAQGVHVVLLEEARRGWATAHDDGPRCPLHDGPLDYDDSRQYEEWFCPEPGCGYSVPDQEP